MEEDCSKLQQQQRKPLTILEAADTGPIFQWFFYIKSYRWEPSLEFSLLRKTISELLASLCTSFLHCKCFYNSYFWKLWHLVANLYYTLLLRLLCSFINIFACFINSQFILLPSVLLLFISVWISQMLASCSFIHCSLSHQVNYEMEELPINHTCCMCKSRSLVHIPACWTMKILSSPWGHWLEKPSHTPTTKEDKGLHLHNTSWGCTVLKEGAPSSLQAPSALHISGDKLRIISM